MAAVSPKNLFSSNKFRFYLAGEGFKDNKFDLTVTGMNLPGIQLGLIQQGTSIRTIDRPGDSILFNDLTLEFLITENFEEWLMLFDWLEDLRDFNETSFDNEIVTDGVLVLLTNKNNPSLAIKFTSMFPYNLSDIILSLNSADGENQVGEATFKYIDMVVVENI